MPSVALLAHRVRRVDGPTRTADERELALAYQRDPACRATVVRALTPLARSIAHRYHYAKEPREDLEQVALVGLVKALRGFDPERSRSFAAYAYPTIAGELRRHFRDTGWAVHVPRAAKQLALAVRDAEREAEADGGRTDERIAERLGIRVDEVRLGRRAGNAMHAESLTAPADEDGPAFMADGPADLDEGYVRAEDRMTVDALLGTLPDAERRVLELRFRGGMTQREIGQEVGVSQMQACRIIRASLARLAVGLEADAPAAA